MKLIISIISKDDRGDVTHELISAGYSVTKIPTTGGFLSAGNVTLLVGTEREKVDTAIEIIKKNSRMRKELVPVTAADKQGMRKKTARNPIFKGGFHSFTSFNFN